MYSTPIKVKLIFYSRVLIECKANWITDEYKKCVCVCDKKHINSYRNLCNKNLYSNL